MAVTKRQPNSYKTSHQTSEPAAIIRAALHNRSLWFLVLNFRYLLSVIIFRESGKIRQLVHTFRSPNSHVHITSTGIINCDVSCRSVNWAMATPRHKWLRQNVLRKTHTTFAYQSHWLRFWRFLSVRMRILAYPTRFSVLCTGKKKFRLTSPLGHVRWKVTHCAQRLRLNYAAYQFWLIKLFAQMANYFPWKTI